MPTALTSTAMTACAMFVCLVPALSGCGGADGASFETLLHGDTVPLRNAPAPSSSLLLAAGGLAGPAHGAAASGGELQTAGSPAATVVTAPASARTAAQPEHPASQPNALSRAPASDVNAAPDDPSSSSADVAGGTTPGGRRLATRPRGNPAAADPLDHWGHRHSRKLVHGLSLAVPAAGHDATDPSDAANGGAGRRQLAGSGPSGR